MYFLGKLFFFNMNLFLVFSCLHWCLNWVPVPRTGPEGWMILTARPELASQTTPVYRVDEISDVVKDRVRKNLCVVWTNQILLTFSSDTKLLFSVDAACFNLLDVLHNSC